MPGQPGTLRDVAAGLSDTPLPGARQNPRIQPVFPRQSVKTGLSPARRVQPPPPPVEKLKSEAERKAAPTQEKKRHSAFPQLM